MPELSLRELRELVCPSSDPEITVSPSVKIVVLQRGWIVVGFYSRQGDGISITNASVIRQWGTTRGLGELAASGPLSDTKLDPCGVVSAPLLGVVLTVDCDASKWRETCK